MFTFRDHVGCGSGWVVFDYSNWELLGKPGLWLGWPFYNERLLKIFLKIETENVANIL